VDRADHECDEQALDLVTGERYEIAEGRLTSVFVLPERFSWRI
jgi:hypothetical protein